MGSIVHGTERAVLGAAFDVVLNKVNRNDREEELVKLVNLMENYTKNYFEEKDYDRMRALISDRNGNINHYINRVLDEVDPKVLKKVALNFGLEAMLNGTRTIRKMREVHQCNIPWLILIDPTTACNLKCTGCWAAEYGNQLSLTFEEMDHLVEQGKELGVYFYMFTGGEPLMRKKDLIRLCEKHNDCAFLSFTNGTLVDEDFCKEMKRVGNFALAISLEGYEEVNDSRRGKGVYKKVMKAMDLLKSYGLVFGTSICYTSKNCETVTSEEFVKFMVEKGCKYAMYFHYMPVGNDASIELLPTPEQRMYVKERVRKIRRLEDGEGLFTMDFQNDGEFVGGCIAGGRNYFHINANGDAEPCVFIHYSGANIKTHSLLEILHQPLFMAYRDHQPFNQNHLRPCPMLENPEILPQLVRDSKAKSTDLQSPETADHLCEKCKAYASAWEPYAVKCWNEAESHHQSRYQNYKREFVQKNGSQ